MTSSSGGDRADRGRDEPSPGMTSAIQRGGRGRACWPTPPSATIIARPTVSAPRSGPSGSGRGRASRGRGAPRGGSTAANGDAGDRGDGRRTSGRERGDEQERVDRERPDDAGADAAAARRAARRRHGEEDDDEPAQPGAAGRGRIGPRLQGLDRRDATGPAGRLERRPPGSRTIPTTSGDERRQSSGEAGRVDGDADGPDVADHARAPASTERRRRASDPTTPSRSAWTRTNRVIWPRVAPAARSRPSSRTRSITVIDSVLKMRNAPGEQGDRGDQRGRRLEVGGRGAERGGEVLRRREDVRLDESARPRARRDRRPASRPGAEDDVDAGDAVVVEDGRAPSAAGTTTVRPTRPTSGPSPARIPTTAIRDGVAGAALEVSSRAERRPSSAARRSVISAPGSSGREGRAGDERDVVDLRLGNGSMPRTVTGGGRPSPVERLRHEVGPALEGGRGDGDARRLVDRGHASRRQAGLAERGDPQVRPADEVAHGPVDRRPRCRRSSARPANSTATPRATPSDASGASRSGRARRLRQASDVSDIAARAYSPSWASRAMSGAASWLRAGRARSSSRMRPSPMTRTRSAYAAAFESWVTRTIVWPRSTQDRQSASRISVPVV